MQAQLDRLSDWFDPLSGSMTAFSGGVDSALVLYLSKRFL
jgi:PP-loop superfamily ATP-utilizing enzyme